MCPRKQTTEPKLLILVSFFSGEVTSYTDPTCSYCIHILWEVFRSVFYGPPCICLLPQSVLARFMFWGCLSIHSRSRYHNAWLAYISQLMLNFLVGDISIDSDAVRNDECFHFFIVHHQGCSYGGRRRAGPPTTHDFRPTLKVPGTIFHNRGSIIAQYTYVYIHWKGPCQALNPRWGMHCLWTPGHWRCASFASLTPLAIIIHNYIPPLRLGWLQPCSP